jgi:polyphosphate glucokinase
MLNDAAMQALGNYTGGRMLFLGFGTGMGSAMVVDDIVLPLELAHLPYRKGKTYEEYVGAQGRKELGDHRWRHHCRQVATMLREALQMQDLVIGGGNARNLRRLPQGARIGHHDAAFLGGLKMWGIADWEESPR